MKIQELAIIFIIIIIPISLVLSVYTQYQIQTLNTQTQYDMQLTMATYDAIKAFQINTANSTMSDISTSKIRDVEASVQAFKNSIISTFKLKGYTEEQLNDFIPALVYTMYDGFYIYSPYKNVNNLYEFEKDEYGNIEYKKDENGDKIPLNNNGKTMFGLKPYITYSCKYTSGTAYDVVITYSLDNYITVQGTVNGQYVNKEGYLIDGITKDAAGNIEYNGEKIGEEALKEYVDGKTYPYAKINGTKYYLDESAGEVFYMSNGKKTVQVKNVEATKTTYANYVERILHNKAAIQYYTDAFDFTNWLKSSGLNNIKYKEAKEITYVQDGSGTTKWIEKPLFETGKYDDGFLGKDVFKSQSGINIESDLSNFNQHRLAVIRHKIESNLAVAIANYNEYSRAEGVDFQLPELKEEEWDFIINNISLISFVQGIDIGGKLYEGYSIINNTETNEVVQEENIYILGKDKSYHRVGDRYLEENNGDKIGVDSGEIQVPVHSAGRANLDFEKQKIIKDEETRYYYPLKDFYGSYNSIITQNNVTTYEDIYKYIEEKKGEGNRNLAKAFYTALGRERYGIYKALRTNQLY